MSTFDDDVRRSAPDRSGALWNILTILLLLGVAVVVIVFLLIYTNPYTALNPFPPPTIPPKLVLPTSTATVRVVPTATATITPVPTLTDTPRPTFTAIPTATFFVLGPPTQEITPTRPSNGFAYEVRQGSPSAIKNIYHPEQGCNWMGVGGQTVDMSNAPVTGLIVRLGGVLPGVTLPSPMLSLTGVALNYGRAGYEFTLADKPIATKHLLWIQLLDQVGAPLSDKVYFDTYESCEKNLVIIDFKQVR